MTQRFNHGHRATWIIPEWRTLDRVAKRLTRTAYIRGHKVDTPDDPAFMVKYDRRRKQTPHP